MFQAQPCFRRCNTDDKFIIDNIIINTIINTIIESSSCKYYCHYFQMHALCYSYSYVCIASWLASSEPLSIYIATVYVSMHACYCIASYMLLSYPSISQHIQN